MRGASDRGAHVRGAKSDTHLKRSAVNRSNCWIFVVIDHHLTRDHKVSAIDVLKDRLKQNIWIINSKNFNVKYLREAHEVVFYLSSNLDTKGFIGIGVLASKPRPLTASEIAKHGSPSSQFDRAVDLRNTKIWLQVKPAATLVSQLGFVKNKRRWGVYFERGIINLPKPDFELIMGA
jgi:hypothetical protein